MSTDIFVLTLAVIPGEIPGTVRLRHLLKAALRSHGLRCLSVRPGTSEPTATPETTKPNLRSGENVKTRQRPAYRNGGPLGEEHTTANTGPSSGKKNHD